MERREVRRCRLQRVHGRLQRSDSRERRLDGNRSGRELGAHRHKLGRHEMHLPGVAAVDHAPALLAEGAHSVWLAERHCSSFATENEDEAQRVRGRDQLLCAVVELGQHLDQLRHARAECDVSAGQPQALIIRRRT